MAEVAFGPPLLYLSVLLADYLRLVKYYFYALFRSAGPRISLPRRAEPRTVIGSLDGDAEYAAIPVAFCDEEVHRDVIAIGGLGNCRITTSLILPMSCRPPAKLFLETGQQTHECSRSVR